MKLYSWGYRLVISESNDKMYLVIANVPLRTTLVGALNREKSMGRYELVEPEPLWFNSRSQYVKMLFPSK